MSSKRAQRRKSCEGKQRHRNRGAAIAHVRQLAASGHSSGEMNAYRCGFCRSWHVGHVQVYDANAQAGHRGRRL